MKLVVQRVSSAEVVVNKKSVGKIGKGFLVLVGVGKGDTENDAKALAEKLSKLRIMSDPKGKMNLDVKQAGGGILAVSQFTLHANTKKGNRPSFVEAAEPKLAQKLYDHFVVELERLGVKVSTGRFGAYMMIDSKLDGPVTITLKV